MTVIQYTYVIPYLYNNITICPKKKKGAKE